jgi:hypothetical protein
MAEVVGFVASIVTLLQLTGTVIEYIKVTKGASKDRETILNEIRNTQPLLRALQDKCKSPQFQGSISALAARDGPFDQFTTALNTLEKRLKPSKGLSMVGKALVWSFSKKEVVAILATIERLKSLFSLALQNDHT